MQHAWGGGRQHEVSIRADRMARGPAAGRMLVGRVRVTGIHAAGGMRAQRRLVACRDGTAGLLRVPGSPDGAVPPARALAASARIRALHRRGARMPRINEHYLNLNASYLFAE